MRTNIALRVLPGDCYAGGGATDFSEKFCK